MKIVITGGAGFLGHLLSRKLLAGDVGVGGAPPRPLDELVIVDLMPPRAEISADARVSAVVGALEEALPSFEDADLIFHLAGVVSGAAESDFDLGMRTNLDGLRLLLDSCRNRTKTPVLVFSSSLAVYGQDPAAAPLGTISDDSLPRPQSSYGIQKFIGEQLVADYTRRGFVRGRSVRLMTVAVRLGRPNAAASSFLSGMIREPLAGVASECPVPPDTPVALSSPRRTIAGLLRTAEVSDVEWGSRTAMNLPSLTTTPNEMAAALDRVTGQDTSRLITYADDQTVIDIVGSWPSRFDAERARRLGLLPEESFDAIVRAYIDDSSTLNPTHPLEKK